MNLPLLATIVLLTGCAASQPKRYDHPHVSGHGCESITFPAEGYVRCTHKDHDWSMTNDGWIVCRCR